MLQKYTYAVVSSYCGHTKSSEEKLNKLAKEGFEIYEINTTNDYIYWTLRREVSTTYRG